MLKFAFKVRLVEMVKIHKKQQRGKVLETNRTERLG